MASARDRLRAANGRLTILGKTESTVPFRVHVPYQPCLPCFWAAEKAQNKESMASASWKESRTKKRGAHPFETGGLSVKGYSYTVCIYTYRYPFVDTPSKLAVCP